MAKEDTRTNAAAAIEEDDNLHKKIPLTFDQISDYVKQEIQIAMFLHNMDVLVEKAEAVVEVKAVAEAEVEAAAESAAKAVAEAEAKAKAKMDVEEGEKVKTGDQVGGAEPSSVFALFDSVFYNVMAMFTNATGSSAEDNTGESSGEDTEDTGSIPINEDNELYRLYKWMVDKQKKAITVAAGPTGTDAMDVVNPDSKEEDTDMVSLYNKYFENKFEVQRGADDRTEVAVIPDVDEFLEYLETMSIPSSREEFVVSAFTNSDDYDTYIASAYINTPEDSGQDNIDRETREIDRETRENVQKKRRSANSSGIAENVIRQTVRRRPVIRQLTLRANVHRNVDHVVKALKNLEMDGYAAGERRFNTLVRELEAAIASTTTTTPTTTTTAATTAAPVPAPAPTPAPAQASSQSRQGAPLTQKSKGLRTDLVKFVAKTALWLFADACTGDTTDDGVPPNKRRKLGSGNGLHDIENGILNKIISTPSTGLYDSTLIYEVKTYIDTLVNSESVKKIEKSALCSDGTNASSGKYIINNATQISNEHKEKTGPKVSAADDDLIRAKKCLFCPATSILDAQLCCEFSDMKRSPVLKEGYLEHGDMDFTIQSSSPSNLSYQGELIMRKGGKSPETQIVDLKVTIKSPKVENIPTFKFNNLRLTGKGTGTNILSASFVLEQTLQHVFAFFKRQPVGVKTAIAGRGNTKGAYMTNLYNILIHENGNIKTDTGINNSPNSKSLYTGFINNPANISSIHALFVPFSKLVFKGCGDLFQEINAVCEHGGYKKGLGYQSYFKDDALHSQMIRWNRDSNKKRLVLSNDRPSAARAMIMLACTDSGVNALGQAGYLPPSGEMYAIGKSSTQQQKKRAVSTKRKVSTKRGNGNKKTRGNGRGKQAASDDRRTQGLPPRGGSLNTRKRRVGHRRTRRSIH